VVGLVAYAMVIGCAPRASHGNRDGNRSGSGAIDEYDPSTLQDVYAHKFLWSC
jgi:hypothetical protein